MSRVTVETNNIPVVLEVTINSDAFRDVLIYVLKPEFENTAIVCREMRFRGIRTFKLMLPINGEKVIVVAKDKNTGDEKPKIVGIKKLHLETKIPDELFNNKLIPEFVRHALDFCLRASFLPEGDYNSKDGNIKIKYTKLLKAYDKDGNLRETKSVARVETKSKTIEVSKDYFKALTVSGRFSVLCHEFAHVYMNKNVKNEEEAEEEADENARKIYLGLGFSRVDMLTTWIKVYKNADTPSNRIRLDKYFDAAKKEELKDKSKK